MPRTNLIRRRTFLAALAGAAAACSRFETKHPAGTLAWSDVESLWLRDLPDGQPRRFANGTRIGWPKFSPSGRWVSFLDGTVARVLPATGDRTREAHWNVGGVGENPLIWLGHRDELAVPIANPKSGEPGDAYRIFNASDNFRTPRERFPLGVDADFNLGMAVDSSGKYAWSSSLQLPACDRCGIEVQATLRLGSLAHPEGSKALDKSRGFFDVAGFTPGGKWLIYWKADDVGVSASADGLDLFAANTETGRVLNPKLVSLVHEDMVAVSPTKEMVAVTAGAGRETWQDKSIAVIDLSGSEPSVLPLTGPSAAAQLPAWSPDGNKLAWCSAPDAAFLDKQAMLRQGQKSITVVGPGRGASTTIPITPGARLGADQATWDRCMRQRRIFVSGLGPNDRPRQLLNDAKYSDERPIWSRDGSHILFCRADATVPRDAHPDPWTIWLMRADGSDARQIAGPLRLPPEDADVGTIGFRLYYGYTDWAKFFDWWRGAPA